MDWAEAERGEGGEVLIGVLVGHFFLLLKLLHLFLNSCRVFFGLSIV